MKKNNNPIYYRYQFKLDNNKSVMIEVNLHPETLEYMPPKDRKVPHWAMFDYSPCDQCVNHKKDLNYCPVAANISEVVVAFKDLYSYDVVDINVETRERVYSKEKISMQKALSSLLGIYMVTSGCEDLDKLRPMVKYHLPFASIEETVYRATSMYLLAQYFRNKKGLKTDWDMVELSNIYQRINNINVNVCKRLQVISEKDASVNAVVILDVFAQMIPISLEKTLSELEHLFAPYLNEL